VFALCFAKLIVCENHPVLLEYNCTTIGLPTVVIIAGQGPGLPSVEFFMPMFDNCSAAMDKTIAFLRPGELCPLWSLQAI
jgi:hypothetical protein